MSPLDREGRVFTRYLIGQEPTDYVIAKYRAFHALPTPRHPEPPTAFERLQLAAARWHPWLTRLADAYGRIFLPRGILRAKLILVLALLESSAPSYRAIDAVDEGSRSLLWVRLACSVAGALLALLVAVGLFLPIHVADRMYEKLKSFGRSEPRHEVLTRDGPDSTVAHLTRIAPLAEVLPRHS
jgi:hypothetical protein